MCMAQILQCLFIPRTFLPQLIHFLIGAAGKEFRQGMFQRLQFLLALEAGHSIQQFQLCGVKYGSAHTLSIIKTFLLTPQRFH